MELKNWESRPKSNLVKWLMQYGNVTYDEAAIVLNISKSYFNNKLHRNSFSFEDIVAIAQVCGYELAFRAYDSSIDKDHDALGALPAMFCDSEVYERINKVYEMREERKRKDEEKLHYQEEYLRMKQELAEYKTKYGIKD